MKGNLSRLVPAVKRELREAEERKKRRLAEEALKLKAEQLEKSNEELTRFAFAASHDMKEPLRQILLYSQVLKESYGDKFSNEGNESVNAIVDGASRMLELVDGLITYSSIDPHNINYESIDANKIVGEAVQNLQVLIAESGASIVCGTLPTLMGRPAHILQLFQNLLSNSLKYRRKDQKLEIKIHAKKLNGDWLFSFADNGSGFEQAYADQIFHVFQRLHGSDFPGSGIGLATCKKVVELHGGRIWAESQPDKGASFYFSLPSGATES